MVSYSDIRTGNQEVSQFVVAVARTVQQAVLDICWLLCRAGHTGCREQSLTGTKKENSERERTENQRKIRTRRQSIESQRVRVGSTQ